MGIWIILKHNLERVILVCHQDPYWLLILVAFRAYGYQHLYVPESQDSFELEPSRRSWLIESQVELDCTVVITIAR